MIRPVSASFNKVSFGNQLNDKDSHMVETAAGVGGAATVVKGGQVLKNNSTTALLKSGETIKGMAATSKKFTTAVNNGKAEKQFFERWFLSAVDRLQNMKIFKPITNFVAKHSWVKRTAGAFGTVLAFATCTTELANIVNVSSKLTGNKG